MQIEIHELDEDNEFDDKKIFEEVEPETSDY